MNLWQVRAFWIYSHFSSLQVWKWQIRHELQVMKYSEKMSRRRFCLRREQAAWIRIAHTPNRTLEWDIVDLWDEASNAQRTRQVTWAFTAATHWVGCDNESILFKVLRNEQLISTSINLELIAITATSESSWGCGSSDSQKFQRRNGQQRICCD